MHRALRPVLAVPVCFVLAACSGGIAPGAGRATSTSAPANDVVPDKVSCPQTVLDLVSALEDLDSRLGVGLTQTQYAEKVGDIKVAYDKIDISALDPTCLTNVAVHAEGAMNTYIEANSAWNKCITDPSCDSATNTTALQSKWTDATNLLTKIKDALK